MSGPLRYASRPVRSLEDRIAALRELILVGLRDPEMRRLALSITSRCEARDDLCELRAIFDYNKAHIRYTGDIAGVDTFVTWAAALHFGGDDCDGHTVANATAAAHNGFSCIARVSSAGDDPEHIYCVALFPKMSPTSGVALDTTLPNGRLGDEPTQVRRYWDFPLVGT